MAATILSFVVYVSDNSTVDYTFDMPYLDRDHIRVYVNDVASGDFQWVTPYTIRFNEAPEINAAIMIRRETPKAPLTAVANGSSLRAEDLNRQMLQAMYVAQESADIATLAVTGTLHAPDSDAGLITLELPSIIDRKDGVLGFDTDGQFRVLTSADMPKGETGDKGPVGDVGPEGPIGPTGPQGGQGPIGLPFAPNYQGLTAGRAAYDGAIQGTSYLDYEAGILYWKLSNTSGNWSTGAEFGLGPEGPQGPLGATGGTGPQGPAGPTGDSGVNWRGGYSDLTAYSIKDGVSYNGSSYRCTAASTGNLPTNGSFWATIAVKGDAGPAGPTGATGPTGPQGPGANVGDIVFRAKNDVPTGFVKANGAALSRTTYAALFSTIGVLYGAGDGSTTFNVPDLRGEFIRGYDDGRGVDTGRVFGSGQADAYENHDHTGIALAAGAHYHTGTTSNGSTNHSHGGIPTSSVDGAAQTAKQGGAPNGGSTVTGQSGSLHTHTFTTTTSATHLHNLDINASTTGGTETRPRNVALLALIRY